MKTSLYGPLLQARAPELFVVWGYTQSRSALPVLVFWKTEALTLLGVHWQCDSWVTGLPLLGSGGHLPGHICKFHCGCGSATAVSLGLLPLLGGNASAATLVHQLFLPLGAADHTNMGRRDLSVFRV